MIDFMIMEAVAVRVSDEDRKQQEEQAKKQWKQDKGGLDSLREAAG